MIKKLSFLGLFALCFSGHAQLAVDTNTETPTALALSVFQVPGVELSNITFNGSAANANAISDQIGRFHNGQTTNLGLDGGVIMSTGQATIAIGPNNLGGASAPTGNPVAGDVDLALLSTNVIYNKACLEFDFVPQGQELSFNYIFASEEYPEFANSQWNDVMGFFLSGPGITGPYSNNARNIALILPSTTPMAINNLNNGTSNTGPCEYCQFYVNNGTGTTPLINSTIQYDGFTTVFYTKAELIPGETYHLKLAIANAGDNSYDSAIFFKSIAIGGLSAAEFQAAQNIWLSFPEKGILQVQAGKQKTLDKITIYDLLGKKVSQTTAVFSDNVSIDISALQKGVYIADTETTDRASVKKKIVIK